ncbi:hypothetical protein NSU_0540 [Novosphingobium pentaromativorans US6-1]|uniref:SnoaL-like domain-containing protein n=2 Tax=Novosphingobium pentaromativorans TaxID=205844 RepID=G6E869_9SPHN|nr:hypothetical protein NSU_0540 [Novosphingobium pentaromativorans US6-1]
MHSYNMAGDSLRWPDFIALFAEDGILELEAFGNIEAFRHEGREAIREWTEGHGRMKEKAQEKAGKGAFVRHQLSTCTIELTGPDTAKARSYFTVYTQIGPDHTGDYIDRYRRVGDRWLIAHRRICLKWMSSLKSSG